MRRIDTLNKAPDLFGVGKHGWKNGVPGTSDRPTEGRAEWFNAVQEEIGRVIEEAGSALDPDNNGQLLASVRKLFSREIVSTTEKGAVADGVTLDQAAVSTAIASLAGTGGTINAPGTSLLSFGRKLYPGLVSVNHHDYATVGVDEKISNPTFSSGASGWTRSNFTASGGPDKITHAAGTVGTASIAGLTLDPYCLYRVKIKIATTASGVVNLMLNGVDLVPGVYTDGAGAPIDGYWFDALPVQTYGSGANGVGSASGWPATSAAEWTFLYLHTAAAASTGDFAIATDTRWAGSIESISCVKVQQEAQFAFSSLTQSEATEGTYRTPIGLKNYNNGSGCVVFGDRRAGALIPQTPGAAPYAGALNTILGYAAGTSQVSGVENVFLGAFAGEAVDGSANFFGGYSAGRYATKAMECTGLGYKSQASGAIGIGNTSCGYETLFRNISGSYVTAVGWVAGRLGTQPSRCSYFGAAAGVSNKAGTDNTLLGFRAGPWTADLGTATTSYSYQTAVGSGAKVFGGGSTVVGYGAAVGAVGSPVTESTAVGFGSSVTGEHSVAVGDAASVTAVQATAVGSQAAVLGVGGVAAGVNARAVGSESVAVGSSARGQGARAASVGRGAGLNLTGADNTSVGSLAGVQAAPRNFSNTTSLGSGATPSASNQVTLGNASVTTLRCQVTSITALSDERDKANVRPLEVPDAFIDEVQAVMWEWAMRGGSALDGSTAFGATAQHLKALQEARGVQWLRLVDESNPDRLEATPGKLLFPLILKVQSQSRALAALAARVESLEARLPSA